MAYGGRARGDYGGGGYRGDSIFRRLARGVAGVVGGIVRASPIGQVVGGIAGGTRSFGGGAGPQMPGGAMPEPGARGVIHRMAPGGSSGYVDKSGRTIRYRKDGKPYKRPSMNPLNGRAASRAIRRIAGARKMLQRIERELPHRKATAHKVKVCR